MIPNSGDPSRPCPGVPDEQVYDAQTNPDGVRCTLQDYMVNAFGRDEHGWARRGFDNIGIQYGLKGLRQGLISPAQFVDFNTHIGGADLDLNITAERTAGRPDRAPAPLPDRRDQLGQQPRPGRDHRPARARPGRLPRRLPHLRDAGAPAAQLRHRGQPGAVARPGAADRRPVVRRRRRLRHGPLAGPRPRRPAQGPAGAQDHRGQARQRRRPLHRRRRRRAAGGGLRPDGGRLRHAAPGRRRAR